MEIRTTAAFHGIRLPERNEKAGGKGDKLAVEDLSEKQKAAMERTLREAQERVKNERARSSN